MPNFVPFLKMHGLGNDFVIFDARERPFSLSAQDCAAVADRKTGVGCDQVIVLEPPQDARADLFMRIYNADGTQAQACGNATRCVAHILMQEQQSLSCTIQTVAGLLPAYRADAQDLLITVNMGAERLGWQEIPLSKPQDTLALDLSFETLRAPVAVNMGNPHCCWFVDDLDQALHARMGAWLQSQPLFPEKSNTHFVKVIDEHHIAMLIWERGVGPTLASGSSACAGAVAAVRKGLCHGTIKVTMPGGEALITVQADKQGVLMQGPYAYVFQGTLALPIGSFVLQNS